MFLQSVKSAVRASVPRPLLEAYFERRFFATRGWRNLHFGRFASFDEARRFLAEHGVAGGYAQDQEAWAAERSDAFMAHDYPVLYWLSRIVGPGMRLVDLGGSVGVSYRVYGRRLGLPDSFAWQVSELPEVVALGRRMAATEGLPPQLSFTEDWRALDGADILLSAGALQFMDLRLAEMLAQVQAPPRHVLVNRIALAEHGDGYVTLQNTGLTGVPMRVERLEAFMAAMRAGGYECIDQWVCLQNSVHVPFHPDCALRHFHGFYFRRADH